MFKKIIASKNKTFLSFCFCFLCGAGFFSYINSGNLFYYVVPGFFITSFLVLFLWKKIYVRFFLFCLAVFLLGAIRFLITFPLEENSILQFDKKTQRVVGVISSEPDRRIDKAYYILRIEAVQEEKFSKSIHGKVIVTLPLYPEFNYGEKIELTCKLEKPKPSEESTFRYDKYLAQKGVWSICSFPKNIKKIADAKTNLFSFILYFKDSIKNRIEYIWSEPISSFMAGVLYGSKQGFSEKLMNYFSRTGVTHIIAVSGFNISIIALILMRGAILVGFYRRQAFWIVVIMIILFVIFTGASASAVRAAIMGIITLYAEKSGRISQIGLVLVYTATFMMIINPYVLMWDAGFQLSFLATLGLVYISPLLKLKFPTEKLPKFLQTTLENFISTMSAIIATLPFILFQFGTLSLVAPLVNVLVLWIIPYLMLIGFSALVISFVYVPLASLVGEVGSLGVKYVLTIVEWFGSKEWAAAQIIFPWWLMIVLYIFMIQLGVRKFKKQSVYV